MKDVKIVQKPFITRGTDKWGRYYGQYRSVKYVGYVDDRIFKKIESFQDGTVNKPKDHLYQFNMRLEKKEKEENRYIRMIVTLGDKTIYKYNLLFELWFLALKVKVFFMNLKVKNET